MKYRTADVTVSHFVKVIHYVTEILVKDFNAFCQQTGHELLQLDTVDGVFTFYIKKRSS